LLVIPEYSRHPWRSRYAPPQPAPDLIRGRSRLQSCKRSREAISVTQRLCISVLVRKSLGPGFCRDDERWGWSKFPWRSL